MCLLLVDDYVSRRVLQAVLCPYLHLLDGEVPYYVFRCIAITPGTLCLDVVAQLLYIGFTCISAS